MAAIDNTIRSFDPLKGLLATKPGGQPVHGTGANSASGRGFNHEGLAKAFEYTGNAVEGQHLGTAGLLGFAARSDPNLKQVFQMLDKPAKIADRVFVPAEEAVWAAKNMNDGVPAQAAIPAAAIRTGGRLAAARAGAEIGFRLPPHPVGKLVGAVVGGVAGGLLGDELPSSKDISDGLLKVHRQYGKNPFYGMP